MQSYGFITFRSALAHFHLATGSALVRKVGDTSKLIVRQAKLQHLGLSFSVFTVSREDSVVFVSFAYKWMLWSGCLNYWDLVVWAIYHTLVKPQLCFPIYSAEEIVFLMASFCVSMTAWLLHQQRKKTQESHHLNNPCCFGFCCCYSDLALGVGYLSCF